MIIECGFLSNPVDEANLCSPEYRAELAYSIFTAIAAFVSSREPSDGGQFTFCYRVFAPDGRGGVS